MSLFRFSLVNMQLTSPRLLVSLFRHQTCHPCSTAYLGMTATPQSPIEVLPLTPEHLADVTRLHRFSSSAAGSVFVSRDFTVVLEAAAARSDG
jgi:hypothetical protein